MKRKMRQRRLKQAQAATADLRRMRTQERRELELFARTTPFPLLAHFARHGLPAPTFTELEVEIVGDSSLQAGSHLMSRAKLAELKSLQTKLPVRGKRKPWGLAEQLNRQAKEGRIGSGQRRHNNGERMSLPR